MKKYLLPLVFIASLLMGCANNQTPSEPAGKDELVSISVTGFPKVDYTEGDCFDPTGLKITTISKQEVQTVVDYAGNESSFTFNPSLTTALTTDDTKVTITYSSLTTEIMIAVQESTTPPEGTFTFTVDFSKAELTNTSSSNFQDKFLPNFDYEDANLVSNLTTAGYAQINTNKQVTEEKEWNEQALMIGNASGKGEFNFTFTKKLVSVSFVARAHMKLYKSGSNYGISADAGSKLIVNGEEWSFATPTKEAHETVEREFDIDSSSLTIKTLDDSAKRVWVFSAEFVFEA